MCCILCDEPVRSLSAGLASFAVVAVIKIVRAKLGHPGPASTQSTDQRNAVCRMRATEAGTL
jgi:hypothetical protein